MKKTKLNLKQKLKTFCLSIIISFLFLIFLSFSSWWSSHFKSANFFELVDKFILDTFFVFRNSRFENNPVFKESSSKIILVNIDDYSLDKIGRWPWRRDIFADFIERLELSHPKVIAVDIIFADPDLYTSADYKLAKIFLKYDNIIFALLHYKDSAGKIQIRRPLKKQLTDLSYANKIKLIDQRLGFVGIDPDRDGVARNTQLILPVIGSYPFYSWDILVSAKFLDIPLEKISSLPSNNEFILNNFSIPLNYGLMPINYVLPKIERPEKLEEQDYYKEFQPFWEDTISFYEVMQFSKEKLKKYFQNKLVLVGTTALALEDIKSTPLGKMSGIYIHANIIGSILERNFLKTFKTLDNYLIILFLGMILGLILSQINLILGVLVLSALILIYFFGNYYIFSHYNLLISIFPPLLNLFLVFSGIKIYHQRLNEIEKKEIKSIFGEYLYPKVIDSLIEMKHKGELGLKGKKEKVTIFFSDIRGFTSLSEKFPPEEVVSLLNEYYALMTAIAVKYNAYIDKFIGDCMMLVFSAPMPKNDDAKRAVKAAWEMQKEIINLQEKWRKSGKPTFSIGIGINTGEVILGNIGSKHKMDYTVIGDNVNLAARLYAAAKGGQILISQNTYEEIKDFSIINKLEPIKVKGKEKPVEIYEVLNLKAS